MKFKNNKGETYEILAQDGQYTLLKSNSEESEPFIVAFDLDVDKGVWGKGRHYSDQKTAQESYDELTASVYETDMDNLED